MNEFRLYWFDKGHHQSLRFIILSEDLFKGESLVANTETARFDRFSFKEVFHRNTLVSDTGRSLLIGLIGQQRFRDRQLENTFYDEYRKFRERLYVTLLVHNGEGTPRFPGTKGRLVRLCAENSRPLHLHFFLRRHGSSARVCSEAASKVSDRTQQGSLFRSGWDDDLARHAAPLQSYE